MSACAGWAKAQTQDQNQNQAQDSLPAATSPAPETVSLTVPKGTPLQVVIDREVYAVCFEIPQSQFQIPILESG
jgi:hypothetical protein